jgi:hypothetical protein
MQHPNQQRRITTHRFNSTWHPCDCWSARGFGIGHAFGGGRVYFRPPKVFDGFQRFALNGPFKRIPSFVVVACWVRPGIDRECKEGWVVPRIDPPITGIAEPYWRCSAVREPSPQGRKDRQCQRSPSGTIPRRSACRAWGCRLRTGHFRGAHEHGPPLTSWGADATEPHRHGGQNPRLVRGRLWARNNAYTFRPAVAENRAWFTGSQRLMLAGIC